MKLLYLTSVVTRPNEAGQQKIKRATSPKQNNNDGSLPRSWYEAQGLIPPSGLEDDNLEISDEGTILLREGEFEYEGVDLVFKLDEFSSCIDNEQMGCVIYSTSGDEYWVMEEAQEVADYITWLTTSDFKKWWVGVKISVSDFFRRKKKITYQEILDRPENKQ